MAEVLQSLDLQNKNPPEAKETLVRTLDNLLERYLNLLHDYQSLQSQLSEHLSSGHLSMAQANFSNPNRVRYGQDYYDERMQASCQIEVHSSSPNFVISNPQPPKCYGTQGTEDDNASATNVPNVSNMGNEVAKSDRSVADPLKWFGILSPPALRSSQASFKIAVRDCVPRLASTANEMRMVEIEVRRARKKLAKSLSSLLSSLPDLSSYESLYKHFHAHPELSQQEYETAQTVARHLRDLNVYDVHTGIGGTGLVGVLKNGPGKTVLLRADMDALPVKEDTGLEYASTQTVKDESDDLVKPVMHACGHDMHMTCLLAAADFLANIRDHWKGTLIVLFQPNEERGGGANAMVKDGLYNIVPVPDCVLGQHVMAMRAGNIGSRPGTIMTASNRFKVTLFGRGGHGSMPHRTIDPAVLAANVVIRLQTVVSREVDPFDMAVVTVASLQAGQTENIIADKAEIKVDVRTINAHTRDKVIASIRRIVKAECEASGCVKEPAFEAITVFPLTVNDETLNNTVAESFQEHFANFEPETDRSYASEDVSILGTSQDRPCMYWFFGGTDPQRWDEAEKNGTAYSDIPVNHSPFFAPVIQPTMRVGVEALSLAALTMLRRAST